MDAQSFIGLLRPMPPGFIPSPRAYQAHPEEVHLDGSRCRYGRKRKREKEYAPPLPC